MRQRILQMVVLNDYVRYLPKLKDSPKAVLTMKKGNALVGKADLAVIILASVPMTWQNQYNLNHTTVPESMHALLLDLDNIKGVMVEKQHKKLKAKGKAATAQPEAKSNPITRCLGTRLVKSLGRVAVRSFASVARPTAVSTRPTTPQTAIAMTAIVSPSRQQWVSLLSPRSPTRSLGTIRAWPSCSI